jgi:hypothetical protein
MTHSVEFMHIKGIAARLKPSSKPGTITIETIIIATWLASRHANLEAEKQAHSDHELVRVQVYFLTSAEITLLQADTMSQRSARACQP